MPLGPFPSQGPAAFAQQASRACWKLIEKVKSVEERSQKRKQKNFEALLAPPPHPTPYPHPLPLPPSPCTVDGLRIMAFFSRWGDTEMRDINQNSCNYHSNKEKSGLFLI